MMADLLLRGAGWGVAPNFERRERNHRCTKHLTLVPIHCFVSKWERLKDEWCQKSRWNFTLFNPV